MIAYTNKNVEMRNRLTFSGDWQISYPCEVVGVGRSHDHLTRLGASCLWPNTQTVNQSASFGELLAAGDSSFRHGLSL